MESKERAMRQTAVADCCKLRPIRYSRWGLAEDPVGQIVKVGGVLYNVVGTYRREYPPSIMLQLKHFNGEDAGECVASTALIVPGHFHEGTD